MQECVPTEFWYFIIKTVLSNLWNISEQEAQDTTDVLWSYGLIQLTDIAVAPRAGLFLLCNPLN